MPYEEVVTNLLQRLGLGYLLGENHSFDFHLLFRSRATSSLLTLFMREILST